MGSPHVRGPGTVGVTERSDPKARTADGFVLSEKLGAFADHWRSQGLRAASVRTLEFLAYRLRERGFAGRAASRIYDWYYALPRCGWPGTYIAAGEIETREVGRSGLLSDGSSGTLIWQAAGPQTHALHDGLLRELCHVPDGLRRPAMLEAGSYTAAAVQFVRFEGAFVFPHW